MFQRIAIAMSNANRKRNVISKFLRTLVIMSGIQRRMVDLRVTRKVDRDPNEESETGFKDVHKTLYYGNAIFHETTRNQ